MASPLEITMALHYCTTPEPYALRHPEHRSSLAVAEIHRRWLENGFLVVSTRPGVEYDATEGLHVWKAALCCVPKPVRQWVIPTKGSTL